MTTPYRCPDCGGTLFLDETAETEIVLAPKFHVRGRPLPVRRQSVPVAFCSQCEFSLEIQADHKVRCRIGTK